MLEMNFLDEKYGAIVEGGKRSVDTWELGIDLKVSLMADGVYNEAFDRPHMYDEDKKVYEDVRLQLTSMIARAYEEEEDMYCDDWDSVLEEWVESFDKTSLNALESTIEGLVNDLMKFAKGGQLYAESLKNEKGE